MNRCKDCGAPDAKYTVQGGGLVCENCVGSYFVCSSCAKLFYRDDYENGDAGRGLCTQCASAR